MKLEAIQNLSEKTYKPKVIAQIEKDESISSAESFQSNILLQEMVDENGKPTVEAYRNAVNKLNEFMDYNQKNSKFVFHEKLDKYYVEVVDSETQEVVKEVPPKALLDAYYEMQKLLGKMFDQQV